MSGGSYNYLYCAEVSDLLCNRDEDLHRMEDRLRELGYGGEALLTAWLRHRASAARESLLQDQQRLGPIWQAVEWLDSGDWSEEQVSEIWQSLERARWDNLHRLAEEFRKRSL